MNTFTNESLDVTQLPKFEQVEFNPLHKDYWAVCLIGIAFGLFIMMGTIAAILVYVEELFPYRIYFIAGALAMMVLILLFSRIGFRKKGFAFRNHDVLFRHGVIATDTIVIPYNRIQHVALHEGLVSRYYGLAEVQIFTAGGKESDIMIPGIKKEQAENIKQLLMGKIQKQL
ncbi:MAG TPA: PH domain-containing protein [Flavobacterium sp.]